MTSDEDWIVVVVPLPVAEAREAYERWKDSHPDVSRLRDDDIRIDLMRTTSGDRVRYLVRAEAWRNLGVETSRGQQDPQG